MVQVAKKHAVSEQTIYACHKRFGKLEAVDVKRLRQLEQENGKLKKLVAERDLEIDVMKEVAAKNGERVRPAEADRVRAPARDLASPSVPAVRIPPDPGVSRAARTPDERGPGVPHLEEGGASGASTTSETASRDGSTRPLPATSANQCRTTSCSIGAPTGSSSSASR